MDSGADALVLAVETHEFVADVGYRWNLRLQKRCVVGAMAKYSDVWINYCCQDLLGNQLVSNRLTLPKEEHQPLWSLGSNHCVDGAGYPPNENACCYLR